VVILTPAWVACLWVIEFDSRIVSDPPIPSGDVRTDAFAGVFQADSPG
jgi:hypothetical protein